ncbi:MAG: hypothetical protein ABR586_05705 [Thermoplasmatota archaeon]
MDRRTGAHLGGSLAVTLILVLALLLVTPQGAAVAVGKPTYDGNGAVGVDLHFPDGDRTRVDGLRVTLDCERSGTITAEFDPAGQPIGTPSPYIESVTVDGARQDGYGYGYGYGYWIRLRVRLWLRVRLRVRARRRRPALHDPPARPRLPAR